MSANASHSWGGNHRLPSVDETGEAPPPYARVHRNNGRNPNVLQIVSEGDFWMGLAELEPWMSSFGHQTMSPILLALIKRWDEMDAQRNALGRQLDHLSQMIDYLASRAVPQPSEEAIYQSPANGPREQQQQRREAVRHGESYGRGRVFEQPAPLGTVVPGVAPLGDTAPGADIQDGSGVDPDIWQLVADWPTAGVSHGNARRG